MAEQTARVLMLAALIFLAAIAGVFSLIGASLPEDDSDFGTYNTTMNKFDELNAHTEEIRTSVQSDKPDKGAFGIVDALIDGTVGVFQQMWLSFDILTDIISDFSEGTIGIKIPTWFTTLMISILLIGLAFALMAAWFKWKI